MGVVVGPRHKFVPRGGQPVRKCTCTNCSQLHAIARNLPGATSHVIARNEAHAVNHKASRARVRHGFFDKLYTGGLRDHCREIFEVSPSFHNSTSFFTASGLQILHRTGAGFRRVWCNFARGVLLETKTFENRQTLDTTAGKARRWLKVTIFHSVRSP